MKAARLAVTSHRIAPLALTLIVTAAAAGNDYDSASSDWNGLSAFVSLARGDGMDVRIAEELDWGAVMSTDIVAIIAPSRSVDPGRLERFITSGGSLLLADDFGVSAEALARVGLVRADYTPTPGQTVWRDRPFAPMATPLGAWADGAPVVTNHPSTFARPERHATILAFADGTAVATAAELGDGRLVAIADSSVFINRMMEFVGNVQFTVTSLRWLRNQRASRLLLVIGDARLVGDPKHVLDPAVANTPSKRAVAGVNQLLQSASDFQLTDLALRLALLLACLAAALAAHRWLRPFRHASPLFHWRATHDEGVPTNTDYAEAVTALFHLHDAALDRASPAALASLPAARELRGKLERAMMQRHVEPREFRKLHSAAREVWRRLGTS